MWRMGGSSPAMRSWGQWAADPPPSASAAGPSGRDPGGYPKGGGIRGPSGLVMDGARRTVGGATFPAPGLRELLHSGTVAICGGVTVDRLWHAVPSFPTVSEVWLHLLEAYGL